MTSTSWSRCGLVAAIGVFAMPIVIGLVKWPIIRAGFADKPAQCWLAAALTAASLALQASAIWSLASGTRSGLAWGRRVAVIHAIAALVVFVSAAFAKPILDSVTFVTWYAGWFGPNPQFGTLFESKPDGPWLGLTLLPAFVLAQWVCLMLAENRFALRETWRGVAMSCIATSALMGIWTFCPQLSGGPWLFLKDDSSTFFNIGVAVHLIALWQIAVRSRFDWAWAGLIGFGCLISGLFLTHLNDSSSSTNGSLSSAGIGFLLNTGWYWLSPYLPPIAYGLTGIAAIVLYRTPPRTERAEGVTEAVAA